jgi:hypothetical protein
VEYQRGRGLLELRENQKKITDILFKLTQFAIARKESFEEFNTFILSSVFLTQSVVDNYQSLFPNLYNVSEK